MQDRKGQKVYVVRVSKRSQFLASKIQTTHLEALSFHNDISVWQYSTWLSCQSCFATQWTKRKIPDSKLLADVLTNQSALCTDFMPVFFKGI